MSSSFADEFFFDRGDFMRSCDSKTKYDSEWHAKYAADEAYARSRIRLAWYLCKYCKKWHLTSQV